MRLITDRLSFRFGIKSFRLWFIVRLSTIPLAFPSLQSIPRTIISSPTDFNHSKMKPSDHWWTWKENYWLFMNLKNDDRLQTYTFNIFVFRWRVEDGYEKWRVSLNSNANFNLAGNRVSQENETPQSHINFFS